MSIYRNRKRSKVVKVKLMQPAYIAGWGSKATLTLEDILNNTSTYLDYKDAMWDDSAWKTIYGRDMTLYFKRKKDVREILKCITDTPNPDNYYWRRLHEEWNKILKLGAELHTIHTDITNKGKRCKTFQKWEAPKIDVEIS